MPRVTASASSHLISIIHTSTLQVPASCAAPSWYAPVSTAPESMYVNGVCFFEEVWWKVGRVGLMF
jgi:hypothetical protein